MSPSAVFHAIFWSQTRLFSIARVYSISYGTSFTTRVSFFAYSVRFLPCCCRLRSRPDAARGASSHYASDVLTPTSNQAMQLTADRSVITLEFYEKILSDY